MLEVSCLSVEENYLPYKYNQGSYECDSEIECGSDIECGSFNIDLNKSSRISPAVTNINHKVVS